MFGEVRGVPDSVFIKIARQVEVESLRVIFLQKITFLHVF